MDQSKVQYHLLSHDSSHALPDDDSVQNINDPVQIYQKVRRAGRATAILTAVSSILVAIIILQAVYPASTASQSLLAEAFSPTGLGLLRTLDLRASVPTRFMSANATEAWQAWNAIEAGHGVVALDPQWAAARKLPPTRSHPFDDSKVVYAIEAYHAMHCVRILRQHYALLAAGRPIDWSEEHDAHCFDSLRQHVMCTADDTLLWTNGRGAVGVNQTRRCRSWDALRHWATERTACYHDELNRTESRFGVCDGGDDGLPVGSLLD